MNSRTFSPTTIKKQLMPEQNSSEYNPMYQMVYDQHPTKPPDLHPHPQAQYTS
jgi:hypothetical protein